MNYQQLLQHYTQTVEPNNGDPGFGDRFNQWTNTLMQNAGVGTWEDLPPDVLTNPSYGQVQQAAASTSGLGKSLVDLNTGNQVQDALNSGVADARGGNSSQVQGSQQTGQFTNVGTTDQKVKQDTTQNTNTTNTNTGTQTGTNTGTTTSTGGGTQTNTQTGGTTNNTSTSGTSTTSVNDNLGLGGLIRDSIAGTGAADKTRQGVLSDIATTGGTGFQSSVDQAVRSALSGPGMQGVGDAARSRAAGFGAAEAGRRNLDLRIAAANGLGGPSAAGSLVQQSQPLLGTSTSTTGDSFGSTMQDLVNNIQSTNFGQQLTSGANTLNTTNFGNTIADMTGSTGTNSTGTTANTGNATGSSIGVAKGNMPEQKSGGSCYVCSVFASQGLIDKEDVREAVRYKLYKARTLHMAMGYSLYGPWLAKLVLKSSFVGGLLLPIATRVLYEELRLAGRRKRFRLGAWTLHSIFHYGSAVIGGIAKLCGADLKTRDQSIIQMLKDNNLYFEV